MSEKDESAQPPATHDLQKLTRAAKKCLVCEFAKRSTQTVFGEGGSHASIMIVGEVPGDIEDRKGHPFIGPAGNLLNRLFEELQIHRDQIYVTNAVKHFKFTQRGKRRLHQKPNSQEIRACRPWLISEIEAIQPQVILALGLTAAVAVLERPVRITAERGKWSKTPLGAAEVLPSWHPSAVLRAPEESKRAKMREELKVDLKKAWMRVQTEGQT